MAALGGFVQNQWDVPVNDANYHQDSDKVAAMRYQSIWPVVEALDTSGWLRTEMDYHTYRWTQLIRGMYTFGHNQVAYGRLRALGAGTAAQDTKRRNERLRLKKAYNELVASTVMLYQRVCRFIGNDHRGKPSRMNRNFDPDFLLWSVKWFDLMKTYKWKHAMMEGRTTYRREFRVGPTYVPLEGGNWRDLTRL
ncbi:uncharacterized protein H6S33_008848 [Morchella sextelata]|uniref:uncharacterized protein n=1 Tax=Morchella sextelata TaxID=1174677 RepID=UPI001D03DBAE|nr:uncharacterized protein H6S33_008848 [Morchella sextelata]KAH0612468.1 hypothetical protein H6S33_008848 [Morchella sextelata]